jgi:hypothetical protein
MAYGIMGFSPSLISQQQRISAIPSDPKEKMLAQYITKLAQQNKMGTPEYFMAAGEFQNRQKIRQQQMADQQQMPPVAQQINQQAMATAMEDRGVAALPVGGIGEIGNYTGAAGGIVAFDDGGEVQRFQGQGPSFVQSASSPFGRDIQSFSEAGRRSMLERTPGMIGAYGRPLISPEEDERMRLIQLLNQKFGAQGSLVQGYFMEQSPEQRAQAKDIVSRLPSMSLTELRSLAGTTSAITPTAAPVTPQTTGQRFVGSDVQGSGADVRKADIAAGGRDSPAMPSQVAPYIPKSMQMGELAPAAPSIETVLQRANQIVKSSMGAAPSELTNTQGVANVREALQEAGFDPQFHQNQIAALRKEKEGIKGERQEAANMRLIEMGLGILGGESPYAFVNIGKGASPALKGLAEDFKDIKKIDRERDKAIRDLQTAEQDLKKSTGLAGLAEVQKSRERVDRYNEIRAGKEISVFNTMYNGMVQERIAAAPPADVRSAMIFKNRPDLLEIYKNMQASRYGGGNRISAAILQDYAKNPRKLEMLKDTDPDMYNYIKAELSALAVPSVSGRPTGTVRD